MPAIHAARRERLRALLAEQELDALLVTALVNVTYLSGLVSSNAALLLLPEAGLLVTDGRYATQAREQAPDLDLLVTRPVLPAAIERARERGLRRLGFEAHEMSVATYRALREVRPLDAAEPLVERLRAVKDETELAALRAACAAADAAFAGLLAGPVAGQTERDLAAALEAGLRAHGADGPAFDTIVASGPNGARPHHRAGSRSIDAGDLVTVDFGALVDGYHSDMTRTFAVGAAAGWQRDVYDLVARAQQAGRAALRPGADVQAVDAAARAIIEDAGHGEDYPHGLGHGLGLQIHEAPTLAKTGTGRLDAGMPVTVEPGVYLPGRGGVRIEDTLVVRDGEPELLTWTTKDLLVL